MEVRSVVVVVVVDGEEEEESGIGTPLLHYAEHDQRRNEG